jgi:hypothetical protein
MNQKLRKHWLRKTALFMTLTMGFHICCPLAAYALTAGPGSPEFSSFEPIATTDMVNLSSGDFNYNLPVLEIPGPDGGGYALSLSYHSGTSAEEESSWVGYGFSLNPGAVNRSTRGFPDDYNNTPITNYNKSRPNWSASVTNQAGANVFGNKLFNKGNADEGLTFNISTSRTLRFNNYQGFAAYKGFGVRAKGLVSVGLNASTSAQGTTWNADINIASDLFKKKNKSSKDNPAENTAQKLPENKQKTKMGQLVSNSLLRAADASLGKFSSGLASTYGVWNYGEVVKATSVPRYTATSYNWSVGVNVNPAIVPVGLHGGLSGNFTVNRSDEEEKLKAYGLVYSPATTSKNIMQDYYVEKNTPYNKRSLYLGIPFNNADYFSTSGEGISGGFRFFPRKTGHFYPNQANNQTKILQTGFDISVGTNVGIGISLGIGFQQSNINNWNQKGNTANYQYASQGNVRQKGIFRFSNDMGGTVSYNNSPQEAIDRAGLQVLSPAPGSKSVASNVPSTIRSYADTAKWGSSSYIDYTTYQDTIRFNKKDDFVNTDKNQSYFSTASPTSLREMKITNTDGIAYVYGLPVYTRNETNLQFDVKPNQVPADRYLAYKPNGLKKSTTNTDAYEVDLTKSTAVTGEIRPVPYATHYLMTQIVTADYVDVGNDGIDSTDFGGWTQFHYQQKYGGSSNEWYQWRTPYNGMLYNKNRISDTQDDRGSVAAGEKEVYYLKAIETKTHIAFFVTNKSDWKRWEDIINTNKLLQTGVMLDTLSLKGSQKARLDARGAAIIAATDKASESDTIRGTQELEYLEKIVLIAKKRPDKPIKITRFAYDYSLVANVPNHRDGKYPGNKTTLLSGKLVLKKVWFEYEGIVNARISPYEFVYAYKDANTIEPYVKELYADKLKANTLYSAAAQNPDYAPHISDPWGNVQVYGKARKKYMIPWVYQGTLPPKNAGREPTWTGEINTTATDIEKSFDPAAWQLKQIKLPSGGEILIEYEQKDYAYVQNRTPMVMASLLDYTQEVNVNGTQLGATPTYTINCRDLGLNPSDTDYAAKLLEQKALIEQHYAKDKIYFKFLYNLRKNAGEPSLDNCASEYITGYATLDTVTIVKLKVGDVDEDHLRIQLVGQSSGGEGGRIAVPRQACYDFFTTQALGKWDTPDCRSALEVAYDKRVDNLQNNNIAGKLQLIREIATEVQRRMYRSDFQIPKPYEVGEKLSRSLSFLKIPMVKAKKGGGVRVKRLMMYDPGIETGDAALYGQEYNYQDFKEVNGQMRVISSGVASNEPADAREENPLVSFLPKRNQNWYSRITAGEDLEQAEGPIGESLLPAAAITHSRVVVQNIYTGATGSGFSVHEFFTTKDYPFDKVYEGGNGFDFEDNASGVSYSSLSDEQVNDIFFIPAGFFYYEVNKSWASQGYRFIQNSMNGQVKRMATYAGTYDLQVNKIYEKGFVNKFKRISEQAYDYYQPGEKVRMLNPDGTYYWDVPGKESDVNMEVKQVSERTLDFSLQVDLTIGLVPPPPPFVTAVLGSFNLTDKGVSTHVTAKVLRYPAIVRKITAFQDGVNSITENIAFNPQTGLPVLTRTFDNFNDLRVNNQKLEGSLYSLNLPAAWYYPGMGQKAANPNNSNELTASAGNITSYGKLGNPLRENVANNWAVQPFRQVINASAQTFAQNWFSIPTANPTQEMISTAYSISDADRAALNPIWRPQASYTYRDDLVSANRTGAGVYRGGYMDTLQLFGHWYATKRAIPSQWVLTSRVTQYSPHGNALEEENVLGIRSAVRFGYQQTMPVMVASNAAYSTIAFEDYENIQIGTTTGLAHSGNRALSVSGDLTLLSNFISNEHLHRQGGLVKLWVRATDVPTLSIAVSGNPDTVAMTQVARTGEWMLMSAVLPPEIFPVTGPFTLNLGYSGNQILIDDVRFQPRDAQSTCYVYHIKTLRLIAQFDDQHFGMFYQYNSEGKLVRKLIETEKGIKTVQETQYNLPKKSRKEPRDSIN